MPFSTCFISSCLFLSHSSLLFRPSLKVFHKKSYQPFDRNSIFTDTDLLDSPSSSMSVCLWVCVCVHLHTNPRGRAWPLHVCLCVCSPTVQSVLRESQVICESKEKQIAELKKMSDQSTDSLKNEWEKKVWGRVEGLSIFCSPAPFKQPRAWGRAFDSVRPAELAASRQALLYCCKNLYSFMLCLT